MKSQVEGQRKDKLKYVKLTDIIVGDRFRSDYGDMPEFVASIKDKGIIQPVTIDSNNNLLAGGRRYQGATLAELPDIPCIIRDFVDELDSREIELMENLFRKGFTWQEELSIVAEIDRLYKTKDQNWSGRKTATLLDKSVGSVAEAISMSKMIEVVPALADCKTFDEARKTLKKLEGHAITQELRQRQTSAMASAAPKSVGGMDAGIRACLQLAEKNYIIGDVFPGMEGLKDNGNIQFIECDPPYGIALNEQKAGKDSVTSTVTGYEEIPTEDYPDFLSKLTKELYRVAGKDCWLVFWYGPTHHQLVLESLRSAGWIVDEIPAIWAKPNGQTLQPELYLARGYEPFFVCRKGKPIVVKRGTLNIFGTAPCPTSGSDAKYHPTQRPVKLIETLLDTFVAGRVSVFVPFLGSGATLRACYNLGLSAFGFDLDGKYKNKFMLAVEEDARRNLAEDAD